MRAIVPAAVRYLVLGDAGTKDHLDATQQAVRQLRVEIPLARLIRHIGTGVALRLLLDVLTHDLLTLRRARNQLRSQKRDAVAKRIS